MPADDRQMSSGVVTFGKPGQDWFGTCIGYGETYQAIAQDAWAGLHPDLPMPSEADMEVTIEDVYGPLAKKEE